MNDNQIVNEIFNRKSIRKFKSKKIPKETIIKIITAGQNAPTGGGTQVYSLIIVTDQLKKDNISKLIGRQQFMTDEALWIMICIDWARQYELWEMLGLDIKFGELTELWRGLMDAMLVAENLVIAAEIYGLGSCFNGGVRMRMTEIKDILKLPENVLPVLLLCIGIPDEDPPVRPRWPIEAILHENEYKLPSNEIMRKYYDESNKCLREMGYFRKGINNWAEHWKYRFSENSNKILEKRLRDQLKKIGFS